MRYAVVFALVLVVAPPVAAQAFRPPANFFAQPKQPFKPYRVDWGAPPAAALKSAPKPKVTCGMTVVPADPTIDPKMRVAPPDTGVTFTLRVVPPTICRP